MLAEHLAECRDWTLIAREHWMQGRWVRAEEVLSRGLKCECQEHHHLFVRAGSDSPSVFAGESGRPADPIALVNLHAMLAHLHLALARTSPKILLPHASRCLMTRLRTGTKCRLKSMISNPQIRRRKSSIIPRLQRISIERTLLCKLQELDQKRSRYRWLWGKVSSALLGARIPVPLLMSAPVNLYLARGQPNVAHPLVERLLARQPNNIIALMAQVGKYSAWLDGLIDM